MLGETVTIEMTMLATVLNKCCNVDFLNIPRCKYFVALGEHKLHFIPALIGPFLEVTLIPQPDLRNVMIPIFHDMMDWEQRRSGNFKQVGSALGLGETFCSLLGAGK